MKKQYAVYILFFFSFLIINPVHASSSLNMTAIPTGLAYRLGIPLFAGNILASLLLLLVFVMPFAVLRHRRGWLIELIMGMTSMVLCIALGWLPVYLLFILCMIVAMMFSGRMRGWITGSD